MHRRRLTLLIGFLVAVVVAGGGGVRAPWLPASAPGEPSAPRVASPLTVGHMATAMGRLRME